MNERVKVYVELLDEGTDTWRDTEAEALGDGLYKLLSTNYNPGDEVWAFLPGDTVRLEEGEFVEGGKCWRVRHSNPDVIRIDVEQEKGEIFWARTTNALHLGEGKYEVLPTPHYNLAQER